MEGQHQTNQFAMAHHPAAESMGLGYQGPHIQQSAFSSSSANQPLPSNRKMIDSIQKLRQVLAEQRHQNPEVDEKGRLIASAIENFLETSQSFVQEKNYDEIMQQFAEHVASFIDRAQKEAKAKASEAGASKESIQNNLANTAQNLRRVVQQFFTSTETRSMFREMQDFNDSLFEIADQMRKENKKLTEMSSDVKNDLVSKNFKLLAKVGSTPASKEVRSDILSLFDYWHGSKTNVSQALQDDFASLFDEAMCILERFTERDVRSFWNKIKDIAKEIDNDPESSTFFKTMRETSDAVINNPEKADDPEMIKKGRENFDRGLAVIDKYGDRFREIFKESKAIIHSMQDEKFATAYKQDLKSVGQSLKGNFLETAVQLRALLVPILKQSLEEIKLPRIEETNQASSYTIDNIILKGNECNLDDVSLTFKIGLKDLVQVVLRVKNIQATFRGVEFNYNRTAIPAWSDKGVLDCRFNSPYWKLKWVVDQEKGREPRFELSQVKGGIKKVDIDFVKSEHSVINAVLMPMWTSSLRRSAQNAIENILRGKAEPLTNTLNKYFTTEAMNMETLISGASSSAMHSKTSEPEKTSKITTSH